MLEKLLESRDKIVALKAALIANNNYLAASELKPEIEKANKQIELYITTNPTEKGGE